MKQNNENYRERVQSAVVKAMFEAGRAHDGAADLHINVDAAIEATCAAMAIFAASTVDLIDDREKAGDILDEWADKYADLMRMFAAKVRTGKMSDAGGPRPKPRLVK